MFKSLHMRFVDGTSVTHFRGNSSLMHIMRVRYPEASITYMKNDMYMLSLDDVQFIGSTREVCNKLMERDSSIASYDWNY